MEARLKQETPVKKPITVDEFCADLQKAGIKSLGLPVDKDAIIAALHETIATLRADATKVWEQTVNIEHAFELAQEINELRTDLSRERERHQELRQVVSRVRDVIDKCLKVHAIMEGPKPYLTNLQHLTNELYAIHIDADFLLEPQPAPVDTPEEK